jgi:hypothetical protein
MQLTPGFVNEALYVTIHGNCSSLFQIDFWTDTSDDLVFGDLQHMFDDAVAKLWYHRTTRNVAGSGLSGYQELDSVCHDSGDGEGWPAQISRDTQWLRSAGPSQPTDVGRGKNGDDAGAQAQAARGAQSRRSELSIHHDR